MTTSTTPAIRVEALQAGYGRQRILDGIGFEVPAGQCLAILGENGAGKSTLMQILAGQLRERAGRVSLFGRPGRSLAARRQVAFAPQFLDFPAGLRVRDVLRFVAGLYATPAQLRQAVAADFGLAELEHKAADRLSGGEAKRIALALAFASEAPLLLLDEPSASLDQHYQRTLASYLGRMRGHKTLVFVSHELPESLSVADRLLQMHAGRIVGDERLERPRALCLLSFEAPDCPPLAGALQQRRNGRHWEVRGFDGDALVRQLVSLQVDFSHLRVSQETP